ncbi:MAG: glycosyltransferase [Candidatus Micrarchaeia archaeon]
MVNKKISVIIPAKNEEKYIINPIKGLKVQTRKNFESILVDGGSIDKTVNIAKTYVDFVIVDKRKGIGRARNTGAKKSKGEILIFIDADTMPSKKLIESYAKAFEDKTVVAATGPILPLEKTGVITRLGFKFVSIFFVKAALTLGKPSVVGSNFAVRRDAFFKIKGFNENLITYEDWDLSTRLKKLGRIIFVNDATVFTSIRRIKTWGILGFFKFHFGNMVKYALFKKSKDYYEEIR